MSAGRNPLGVALGRLMGGRQVRPDLSDEQRLDRNALEKAKRLAVKHGISLEREPGKAVAYWVAVELEGKPGNPIEGNHFATSGREVLEAVEAVAAYLAAPAGVPLVGITDPRGQA